MSAPAEHRVSNHGTLKITINSGVAEEELSLNDQDQIFHLGETYRFIKNFDYDFGDIKSIKFKWHRSLGLVVHEHMWIDSLTIVPLSSNNILNRE